MSGAAHPDFMDTPDLQMSAPATGSETFSSPIATDPEVSLELGAAGWFVEIQDVRYESWASISPEGMDALVAWWQIQRKSLNSD